MQDIKPDITQILHDFAEDDSGRSAAFCFTDNPNEIIGIHETVIRPAASTIKIVNVALLLRDHANRLQETVTWQDVGQNNQPALCNTLQTPLRLIDIAALSITTSDNMCADFIQNFVGLTQANAFLQEQKCLNSAIESRHDDESLQKDILKNRWSAADAVRFCAYIFTDPLYKPLRDMMRNVVFYSRMPAAIEPTTLVLHKTGTLTRFGVVNDIGVLTVPRPFALSFLTQDQDNAVKTEQAIAKTTTALFDLTSATA